MTRQDIIESGKNKRKRGGKKSNKKRSNKRKTCHSSVTLRRKIK